DEERAEDAGPHDVDVEHVDVGGAGGEVLLRERELLGGRARGGDHLDLVAGLLLPRLHALLADLELLADRAARDRDLDGTGGRVAGLIRLRGALHGGPGALVALAGLLLLVLLASPAEQHRGPEHRSNKCLHRSVPSEGICDPSVASLAPSLSTPGS